MVSIDFFDGFWNMVCTTFTPLNEPIIEEKPQTRKSRKLNKSVITIMPTKRSKRLNKVLSQKIMEIIT